MTHRFTAKPTSEPHLSRSRSMRATQLLKVDCYCCRTQKMVTAAGPWSACCGPEWTTEHGRSPRPQRHPRPLQSHQQPRCLQGLQGVPRQPCRSPCPCPLGPSRTQRKRRPQSCSTSHPTSTGSKGRVGETNKRWSKGHTLQPTYTRALHSRPHATQHTGQGQLQPPPTDGFMANLTTPHLP